LIGKHIWTEFPEGVGQKFQQAYEQAIANQTPLEIEEYYPPWDRWFSNRIYPSADGLSIAFHDITDRKRAEDELRRSRERLTVLSRRLISAQESERRQLARELHDEIGQMLTAVSILLEGIRQSCVPNLLQRVDKAAALVNHGIQQVRELSLNLRPPVLDDFGLAPALESLFERLGQSTGCEMKLVAQGFTEKLSPDANITLYRVTQEALTNVLRHARARHVWVALRVDDGDVLLEIYDDGVGFDYSAARARAKFGLSMGILGMQERVELLGGKFDIESSDHGTTVRVRLPNARQEAD
jgi:signal transduction histidine kinase